MKRDTARRLFPFRVGVPASHLMRVVRQALAEDAPRGDVTTGLTVGPAARAVAVARLRDRGVVAGFGAFAAAFAAVDRATRVTFEVDEGMWCAPGTVVAVVRGRARGILTAERVALNFMQRLSGVATETRRFVEKVSGTGVAILDTRKTTPGLRLLEKQAVVLGGGRNHRASLSDLVLIKDNHIRAAGGLARAVELARRAGSRLPIEVEVDPDVDLAELRDLPVDVLMFDNWPVRRLGSAIRMARRFPAKPIVEVSGGVSLRNVRGLALCGPDFISVGHITHSAPALDIGLDFESA
jgi:nicotinate-nucleotide pyrophosphorylase (carboxylating)